MSKPGTEWPFVLAGTCFLLLSTVLVMLGSKEVPRWVDMMVGFGWGILAFGLLDSFLHAEETE